MNRVIVSTVLALAAIVSLAGARPASPPSPLTARPELIDPIGESSDYAIVGVGAQAPDFAFEAQGRNLRLRDLRANGHVLLMFAPDEARLVALERERVHLLAIGVVPVAVLDQRAGSCAAAPTARSGAAGRRSP